MVGAKTLLDRPDDPGGKEPFRVHREGGENNSFAVAANSLTVTVGQPVLRRGIVGFGEYLPAKGSRWQFVPRRFVLNPNWDEPLRIASIRSRPQDGACLTTLGRCLGHMRPNERQSV